MLATPRPCLDCGALALNARCTQCAKAKKRTESRRRPSSSKRGYGIKHQRQRRRYLALFPTCQHQGCQAKATDLDHVDGNPANNSWTNYRALCHTHHSQRTAKDQPGGWNLSQS